MRLTRGEAWWILRRRRARTQARVARELRISEDRYRRWERDREAAPWPSHLPTVVTPGEYSAIARRRKGLGITDVALVRGVSRQTLIKMEHDRTASALDLARWWASAPYPKARTAAPVRVRAPQLAG